MIVFWRIVFPLTLPGVVIGQVLVFRVARATVMAGMGWTRIGPDETRAIARTSAAQCDAILDRVAKASPQPIGEQQ